ncbi:hypothetical protein PFICI_03444 [Pestalotiopsis fici W106-1]|uniref:Uncharacterized protein n=1 Tax=Pestalotiopsis fici (strain W106-1 / CGMCC3.15140) TaxID=1229662 RepID=W3XHE9_PESFW|nr:uncharacterized protein PFICI_03444 [Pestalotiopsis fici W106-1]ETS85419.1 hypothetical protein PFICI_03444 [Pestalotiopsis fici W106-1]
MGFFDKIQAKLELYRLEQRYTRNRNRRTTFTSNAVYVDGEYVFNSPNTTGSSSRSAASSSPNSPSEYDVEERQQRPREKQSRRRKSIEEPRSPAFDVETPTLAQKKKLNRFSSMPGFGSSPKTSGAVDSWRMNTVDVREVR